MTEGTIFLLGPLDFEKQSMYHLSLLAIVSIKLLFLARFYRFLMIFDEHVNLLIWSSFTAQFALTLIYNFFSRMLNLKNMVMTIISRRFARSWSALLVFKLIRWKSFIELYHRVFKMFPRFAFLCSSALKIYMLIGFCWSVKRNCITYLKLIFFHFFLTFPRVFSREYSCRNWTLIYMLQTVSSLLWSRQKIS